MMTPLADNVLIEPIDKPQGRIVIPNRSKQLPTRGRVIACGACRTLDSGVTVPMVVKAGDEVLFHQHGVETVTDGDGNEWLLARESDILAVVER